MKPEGASSTSRSSSSEELSSTSPAGAASASASASAGASASASLSSPPLSSPKSMASCSLTRLNSSSTLPRIVDVAALFFSRMRSSSDACFRDACLSISSSSMRYQSLMSASRCSAFSTARTSSSATCSACAPSPALFISSTTSLCSAVLAKARCAFFRGFFAFAGDSTSL